MGQTTSAPRTGFKAEISRILKYAPTELIGREAELKLLHDAWSGRADLPVSPGFGAAQQRRPTKPRVLSFVALGGEGKTSLVAKWAAELAAQDWPGCDAAFAWSFYSQGTREQMASSDPFLKEALTFFAEGDAKEEEIKAFAASPARAFEKGQRLARLVGQRRCLLILDGLEPLQYAPTSPTPGRLKDQGIAALLKGLAAASHGLCVVTTRYSLPDLKAFWQTTAPEKELKRLSKEAGVALLRSSKTGPEVKPVKIRGTQLEFEQLVEDLKGHALSLTLMGSYLVRAHAGDIRQRDRVKFEKADEKMDGGHAFRTMAAYEQWLLRDGGDEGRREVAVLRLMGLFDRPADAGCLAALRSETIPGLTEPLAGLADDDWEYCLSGLEAAKLLTVNRDASGALVSLDAHPLIREYFAMQVRCPGLGRPGAAEPSKGGTTSNAWRTAHRRLYEHLCLTTPDKPQPTLEDLQPFYQAVAHGCQAGLHASALNEVMVGQILKQEEKYSFYVLGAFSQTLSTLALFFETPWRQLLPTLSSKDKLAVLEAAVLAFWSIGPMDEGIKLSVYGMKISTEAQDWVSACDFAGYASGAQLSRGACDLAVEAGRQAVAYLALLDNHHERRNKLTYESHANLAAALFCAGQLDEAVSHFHSAEIAESSCESGCRFLSGLFGCDYCELLITQGRHREARLRLAVMLRHPANRERPLRSAVCRLTLGRSLHLDPSVRSRTRLAQAQQQLALAINSLRDSGDLEYFTRGLMELAEVRLELNESAEALANINEAHEIAARGQMHLHLADILLRRARLFFREKQYPWESPQADLVAARKLIEQCRYGRRKEELEDAERIIGVRAARQCPPEILPSPATRC